MGKLTCFDFGAVWRWWRKGLPHGGNVRVELSAIEEELDDTGSGEESELKVVAGEWSRPDQLPTDMFSSPGSESIVRGVAACDGLRAPWKGGRGGPLAVVVILDILLLLKSWRGVVGEWPGGVARLDLSIRGCCCCCR